MTPPRPRPRLNDINRPFWTGGANGKLHITRCQACGKHIHPPKPICPNCLSEDVFVDPVAGTGSIATYTINYQAWAPGLEVPLVIARVRLDDAPGVYLTTNIINCAVDDVRFDDPVRVVFEEQDGIFYPLFERALPGDAEAAS